MKCYDKKCLSAAEPALGSVRCKANCRISIVEDDKLRFEHDVSENLDVSVLVPLHGAEAHCGRRNVSLYQCRDQGLLTIVTNPCIIHQIAGESSHVGRAHREF